jgi:hypothetical protein
VFVSALPGLLFGTVLTPLEAEATIRQHLVAQAAMKFHRQMLEMKPEVQQTPLDRYSSEIESLTAREFVSADVATVIFGFFSIRRNFVVKTVIREKDQRVSVRYYFFMDKCITGECPKWAWFFAW